MNNSYTTLLSPFSDSSAENKSLYKTLTERHIQAIWFEQKYFSMLQTSKGEVIRVISPGIWNAESGPDFRRAHLIIGQQEWRGDIEIHLADESWYHHHHHEDERYNDVVLHVSLWNPKQRKPILKKNGEEVLSVHLENFLTKPVYKLTQLIDLDLYPYKKFLGSGKCAQQLFSKLPEDEIANFFRSAAHWRLHQKSQYLSTRLQTKSMQLAGGFAMALGYKNNAEAFLELFGWLIDYRHLPEKEVYAIVLGVCGFFDRKVPEEWKKSTPYQEFNTLWWGHVSSATHQAHLVLDHIRPFNHPVRRLAYLVKLLTDPHLENIWHLMLSTWKEYHHECFSRQNWAVMLENLRDKIPTYEDAYWNRHYTFESKRNDKFLSLMGDTLKTEMILNAFLPLLRECVDEQGEWAEIQSFESFYSSMRVAKTSKVEYLSHRFFGDTPKGSILKQAQLQQGAYQLHRDFCLHFEASCEGCPFVKRYKANQRLFIL